MTDNVAVWMVEICVEIKFRAPTRLDASAVVEALLDGASNSLVDFHNRAGRVVRPRHGPRATSPSPSKRYADCARKAPPEYAFQTQN